jgi:hypothetical protein
MIKCSIAISETFEKLANSPRMGRLEKKASQSVQSKYKDYKKCIKYRKVQNVGSCTYA